MKKILAICLSLISLQSFLWSNPIDGTPVAKFSELLFDKGNHWTMEIQLVPGSAIFLDSIVFKLPNNRAKLNLSYFAINGIGIATSDSLSTPLSINRDGDKILIYTYSTSPNNSSTKLVRTDSLIFGNYPGATVGPPLSSYSIMRNILKYSFNYITIDCLTNKPSLGIANDTAGLGGTLKGNIYDSYGNPVTKLKVFPASPSYFVLEGPISIDSNGAYTTNIFPTLSSPYKLLVRLVDFQGWLDSVAIEPFELNDIHPDTIVVHDIHLKDDRYVATSVNDGIFPIDDELTLINYPNPFNSSTNFLVKIPDRLKMKSGNISIVTITGQLVRNIAVNGSRTVSWDGRNAEGKTMPSGCYYYRLYMDKQVLKSGSMILLK